MNAKLQDKVALITGGAQGLGQAICHRSGHGGPIISRSRDLNGERQLKPLQAVSVIPGQRAIAIKVDVSDEVRWKPWSIAPCKNSVTSTLGI